MTCTFDLWNVTCYMYFRPGIRDLLNCNSSDDMKAKFNNCFIIHSNNSYFKNKLKHPTSIDCLSARLGDKGLFSSANILQIAWCCPLVVLATFLANSLSTSSSWNEWNVPSYFCIHYHNNSTQSPGLLSKHLKNLAILLHDWHHQFTYHKILPNKFGWQ